MRESLRSPAAASIAVLLAIAGPACSDDPSGPASTTGSVRVHLSSIGDDLDPNGYVLEVEGAASSSIGTNGVVAFDNLVPGDYVVRLSGFASNCTLHGEHPRTVTVVAGRTTTVSLTVSCVARVGTLRVTVATTGEEFDTDGYLLILNGDGSWTVAAPVNGVVTIGDRREGPVNVTLGGVERNCTAGAASPTPAVVSFAQTTEVSIAVACVATGGILVRVPTTGIDPPAEYALSVRHGDGEVVHAENIGAGGERAVTKLLAGEYDVTLPDVPENCTPAGGITRRLTVRQRETTDATFDVACVAARLLVFATTATPGGIAVVKSNGQEPRVLTKGSPADADPDWSPDGSRIAFSSDRDGIAEIYVMSADGTGITRLTNASGPDLRPAWSPDGTRIAFVAGRDGNPEIYVMSADGSNQARLTNHPGADAEPAWSPDGSKIAFTSDRDGDAEIYVMNADGTGVVALTSDPAWDRQPTWSPDGSRIAFVTDRCSAYCGYFLSLVVTSASGGGPPVVIWQEEGLHDPAWAPGGEWIAVASDCWYYCYDSLLLVHAGTLATRQVVDGNVSRPSWRR